MSPRRTHDVEAPAGTPSSDKCGNQTAPGVSLETARDRIMLLLSQSKLRHELEYQVRYFLSWKLLNFPGDAGASGGQELPAPSTSLGDFSGNDAALHHYGSFPKPRCNKHSIRRSLAFKATVSLVLGWLKAHDLVHAAGVLSPEVGMADVDMLSQEECIDVLRLPLALLEEPSARALACEHRSLLDQLVIFVAQSSGPARARSSPEHVSRWHCETNTHKPGVSSANKRSGRLSEATICASGPVAATRASSEGSRPAVRGPTMCLLRRSSFHETSMPSTSVHQGLLYGQNDNSGKASEVEEARSSRTVLEEEAKTQLQLLAARLRRLELQKSSEKLFTAGAEAQQMINQRLAAIETRHEEKIRRLQKAMTHREQTREAEQEVCRLAAQTAMQGAQQRLQLFLRYQEEAEAALAKRVREVSDREARLADRQERLLCETLRQQFKDNSLKKHERYETLAEENACLRSQLAAATRQVERLEEQLQRHSMGLDNRLQSQTSEGQPTSGDSTACLKQYRQRSTPVQRPREDPAGTDTWALEQEYEGRIARLTEELQRRNEQIRSKEAEFKLLVAELEAARQKGEQAQNRAKRLHKLYSAARTARAQQRQLASSVSLSLKSLELVPEPSVGLISWDCHHKDGTTHINDHGNEPTLIGWREDEEISIEGTQACGGHLEAQMPRTRVRYGSREGWGILQPRDQNMKLIPRAHAEMDQRVQGLHSLPKNHTVINDFDQYERGGLLTSQAQCPGPTALQLPYSAQCNTTDGQPELAREYIQTGYGMTCGRTLAEEEGSTCRAFTGSREYSGGSGFNGGEGVQPQVVACRESSTGCSGTALIPGSLEPLANSVGGRSETDVAPTGSAVHSASTKRESPQGHPAPKDTGDRQSYNTEGNHSMKLPSAVDAIKVSPSTVQGQAYQASLSQASRSNALGPSRCCARSHPREHLPRWEAAVNTQGVPSAGGVLQESKSAEDPPTEFTSMHQHGDVPATAVPCTSNTKGDRTSPAERTDTLPQAEAERACRNAQVSPSVPPTALAQRGIFQSPPAPCPSNLGGKEMPPLTSHSSNGHAATLLEPPPPRAEPSIHCACYQVAIKNLKGSASGRASPWAVPDSGEQRSGGPHPSSPWAEASIASSLPESPKRLSNFPSASCPVAAALDGLVAPACATAEARGICISPLRECSVASESAPSFSPSDNDWLASMSPSPRTSNQKPADRIQNGTAAP